MIEKLIGLPYMDLILYYYFLLTSSYLLHFAKLLQSPWELNLIQLLLLLIVFSTNREELGGSQSYPQMKATVINFDKRHLGTKFYVCQLRFKGNNHHIVSYQFSILHHLMNLNITF